MSEAVAARIEAPQRGGQSDQSMRQMGHFYQVMYHSSGGLRAPHVSQLLTSLGTCFRTGSCSPVLLLVTGQPLLIVWKFAHQC